MSAAGSGGGVCGGVRGDIAAFGTGITADVAVGSFRTRAAGASCGCSLIFAVDPALTPPLADADDRTVRFEPTDLRAAVRLTTVAWREGGPVANE